MVWVKDLCVLVLAALLCGCVAVGGGTVGGEPAAGPAVDGVRAALEAYDAAVGGPGDGTALRAALDQVELAIAVTPAGHALRLELLAAERDLVARLTALQGGPDPGVEPEVGAAVPSPGTAEAPLATAGVDPRATAMLGEGRATPVPGVPVRPAAPRTQAEAAPAAAYSVVTRKSFEGSGNSGQFASCIDVQILDRGGPVAGAVIGINNGDHSYQDQTDQSGYSGRCGLGASTWSVVIFWTPGGGQGAATTVYLSGAPEQRAAVVFQQR